MFNNVFPENRGVNEIMYDNMVELDRLQMTIRIMHFATNTQSE